MNKNVLNEWNGALSEFAVRRSVILCSTFRSGSTYLAELVERNSSLTGLTLEKFGPLANVDETSGSTTSKLLREIFSSTRDGVFASKLMWPHRSEISKLLNLGMDENSVFHNIFPNCTWIHLARRSKFEQAVSFWRAKTSNEWHVYETKDFDHIPYNFDEIDSAFREIVSHDLLWSEFFKRAGIEPILLEYEELCASGFAYLEEKFKASAIYLLPANTAVGAALKKQADVYSSTLVDRYLEDLFKLCR